MALIGYGEAGFYNLIKKGHYYVDRTMFIPLLENLGNRNLLMARPRRFGKSLWISTLQHYYDVRFKDEFDKIFGKYYIGKNPTENRNNYIVLRMQFSGIEVSTDEKAYSGFRQNVKIAIQDCMKNYPNYFVQEEILKIDTIDSPQGMLQEFLFLNNLKEVPYKVYLLIDEYDHFANDLFALDPERFKDIVSRTGFVRNFYEIIKNALGEGKIERNFMTGVAPLTVDAMTSGFNTATHLTLDAEFHDLMGFTHHEVGEILKLVGVKEEEIPNHLQTLTDWYDGYLFNGKAKERLFNSNMIMYFASHYERYRSYPDKMLDTNIASDYTKVKKVFKINSEDTTYIPLLKKITGEGYVTSGITEIFNLEKTFSERDTVSLLYYMGWLTIDGLDEGYFMFKMPNQVIKELYYDYFVEIIEQETNLNRSIDIIERALYQLSKLNNPRPFLDIVKSLIDKQLSLRDALNFDEKHLKMLLIPYLSLSATHYVASEPEWENQYPDILLLKRPNMETKYNFILELKYIKKASKNKKIDPSGEINIDKITKDARQQLAAYLQTDNAKRIPNLKAWLLILVGREWHLIEEIGG